MLKVSVILFGLFLLATPKLEAVEISSNVYTINHFTRQYDVYATKVPCWNIDSSGDVTPTEDGRCDDMNWYLDVNNNLTPRINYWELSEGEIVFIE